MAALHSLSDLPSGPLQYLKSQSEVHNSGLSASFPADTPAFNTGTLANILTSVDYK